MIYEMMLDKQHLHRKITTDNITTYEPAHATMGQVVFSGFEIIEKNFPIFTGYVGSSKKIFRGLGIRLAH